MTAERASRDHTCVTLFVPVTRPSLKDFASHLASNFTISSDGSTLMGAKLPFKVGVQWESNPEDGSFGEAFSFGTCTEDQVEAIDAAPGALVLEIPGELDTFAKEIAALGHALEAAGALAFRIEQSKAGHAAKDWLALISQAGAQSADSVRALFRLAIIGLNGRTEARTIGMHAFSAADIEIEETGPEASRWLHAFALYQIGEDPLFGSGHTFAPDQTTPRRMMEWWPDTMYEPGHPCNNPFGVLRLGPPADKGRAQPELRMNFIPALILLLHAAREKKGSALTEEEITTLRDESPCIAMDPKDVRELERGRGYADLDAERAVECWMAIEESEYAVDEADEAGDGAPEDGDDERGSDLN